MAPRHGGRRHAHYLGIKAFSETDQTEDLKSITVPTLVIQGDDDQIVPYKDASLLQAKLIKDNTLKIYPGYPHGMDTTMRTSSILTCSLSYARDLYYRTGSSRFGNQPSQTAEP